MGNGQLEGFADFAPDRDLPSLKGKVIFITGGTAGIGAESVKALLKHDPEHIYFSGRNAASANRIITELHELRPSVALTFVEMDLTLLSSVKKAIAETFKHDRLDILLSSAGIMAVPPGLSKDGYEIQFATNHLGNAMVIRQPLPVLLRTTETPGTDVRIVSVTSLGFRGHPRGGVVFDQLRTTQEGILGSWMRYGQSKLANIVYARELARRHPNILSVSVHPGVIETGLVTNLSGGKKSFVYISNWLQGVALLKQEQGCLSPVWCVAGGKRDEMVNGGFYTPVGVQSNGKLDKTARDEKLAEELWSWTDGVLAKVL